MKKKKRNMLLGLVAVIVAAAGIAAYQACLLYTSNIGMTRKPETKDLSR